MGEMRRRVDGPPIPPEMQKLFAVFGHGFDLNGVMVVNGEKPSLLLEYASGDVRFQVELAAIAGPVAVKDGEIVTGPLEVN